jgi:uncharacterized protein with HEPN domain
MSKDESRLRVADYLAHMLEAVRLAREYVQGVAQMRGMRNRMAHGYFDIDLNIVWDTVQSSLPDLEGQLQSAASQIKP